MKKSKKTAGFYHEAIEYLFNGEPWICLDGNLYQWQTNHYQKVADSDLISKIQHYCFQHPAIDKNYTGNDFLFQLSLTGWTIFSYFF